MEFFTDNKFRHLMIQPRVGSHWRGINLFQWRPNIYDSIHNFLLWCESGKLNWIEFYIWLQNNNREWKPLFFSKTKKVADIATYLMMINQRPRFSGFETYNNHHNLPTKMTYMILNQVMIS